MESNNLKFKFILASILLILNNLSNDILIYLANILDLKQENLEYKTNNINLIIELLKKQKEEDIEDFTKIL